ncbi:MAG TPA: site-specific integrase, partial [Burkholderiales bacterium]
MRSRSDGAALAREYLDALKNQRRLSPATVRNYAHAIDLLLAENSSLEGLDPAQARRSIAVLHAKGSSPRTLALTLSAWRGFYRWLARHRGFQSNPVLGIRAPKAARPLPKALSVETAQRLLEGEQEGAPLLKQDQAMFELLYSSGLRVGELVALNLDDDPAQGEVTVTGKG